VEAPKEISNFSKNVANGYLAEKERIEDRRQTPLRISLEATQALRGKRGQSPMSRQQRVKEEPGTTRRSLNEQILITEHPRESGCLRGRPAVTRKTDGNKITLSALNKPVSGRTTHKTTGRGKFYSGPNEKKSVSIRSRGIHGGNNLSNIILTIHAEKKKTGAYLRSSADE